MNRRRFILSTASLAAAPTMTARSNIPANMVGKSPPIENKKASPKFLWGASTAAHQVEGNNVNNDYWFLEQLPNSPFTEKSLDACDHYHLYNQDIALLAQMGLNAYRFSLEWARIEPVKGHISKSILRHYRCMLESCHAFGIIPMVTFHHFTSPRWLAADGGWESPQTPALFSQYAKIVTEELGDLIPYICTINELNFSALLDKLNFAPIAKRRGLMQQAAKADGASIFSSPPFGDAETSSKIMIEAHHQAFDQIKSVSKDISVGLTISMTDFQAVEGGEEKLHDIRETVEDRFIHAGKNADFIGVQGYTRTFIDKNGFLPPSKEAKLTQMGYEFWPNALEATLHRTAKVAPEISLIITESGVATNNDSERIQYIDQSLAGMQRALADGIKVSGYFHWSLLDNFEWTNGFTPKFGLISVNPETQQRTIKPSGLHLGAIAQKQPIAGYS